MLSFAPCGSALGAPLSVCEFGAFLCCFAMFVFPVGLALRAGPLQNPSLRPERAPSPQKHRELPPLRMPPTFHACLPSKQKMTLPAVK